MSDSREALLLGAGSQIAPFLSRRLAEGGWSGDAMSRRGPPLQPCLDAAFCWRPFDANTREVVSGDWEVVFSMLPLWLLPPLVARLGRSTRQVVAFSSTSAHSKIASEYPPDRDLALRLLAAEREALIASRDRGIECSLLRPTLIYDGSGRDKNISMIAAFIRRYGFFPVVRPAAGLRQPVHADDLANAAVACVGNPDAGEQTWDLPGGETLSYREMVTRVFTALGRIPRILPLPPAVVRVSFRLTASGLGRGRRLAAMLRMNDDLCYDVSPAKRALGYQPRPFGPSGGSP